MYKLIRFYNQNRRRFWTIILIIVFIICIIQLLNYFTKVNKEQQRNQNITVIESNTNNQGVVSDKSVVSGQSVSSTKLKKDTDVINEFVKYCNDGNINSAYNLLTEECKEEMFPTVEDFNSIYYSNLFDSYKTHTIENWVGNTYKINFTGDILSTGDLSSNKSKQDYITVVKEDGENKLNINSFIERKKIDKQVEVNKIIIKVEKVDVYMDSSVYTVCVKNNSYRTIMLDSFTNIDTMYIEDSKGVKYSAYTHEIAKEKLNLGVSQEKKIDIKYYSKFSSTKDITKMVFSNVISDYERYDSLRDKSKYGNYLKIEINI